MIILYLARVPIPTTIKKYIVIFHAPVELMAKMAESTQEDMDGAKSLLVGHPHLVWDASCEIEVHEVMPLPE